MPRPERCLQFSAKGEADADVAVASGVSVSGDAAVAVSVIAFATWLMLVRSERFEPEFSIAWLHGAAFDGVMPEQHVPAAAAVAMIVRIVRAPLATRRRIATVSFDVKPRVSGTSRRRTRWGGAWRR